MQFYTVRDNSFAKHSFPWVDSLNGLNYQSPCPTCRRAEVGLKDKLEAELMDHKGSKWSDALGCCPAMFLVSERVVEAWQRERFGDLPLKPVTFVGKIPKRLSNGPTPRYFILDGTRMRGAELNAAECGFLNLRRCSTCAGLVYDRATDRPAARKTICFEEGSWSGAHLFTTELRGNYGFFCSQEFVRMARKYRLTNFRFVPIEDEDNAQHEGIDYLET